MTRAPHPVLAGWYRQASAPSRFVAAGRAAEGVLVALGGGLARVGFDAADPWAPLLQGPLGGALRASLARLAADPALPERTDDAAARARSLGTPAAAAVATASRTALDTAFEPSAPRRAAADALVRRAGRAAVNDVTPVAAHEHWHRWATEAGHQAAFDTPLRRPQPAGPAPMTTARPPGPVPHAVAPDAPAAGPSAWAGGGDGARAAAGEPAAEAVTGAQQRLSAVLRRLEPPSTRDAAIDMRRGAAPVWAADAWPGGRGAAWPAAAVPGRSDAVQPGPAWPDGPAALPSAAATALRAPPRPMPPAAPAPAASPLGGLRGLAARAQAAQIAAPDTPAAAAAAVSPAALPTPFGADDDQLVAQFARLLAREARRDGIDVDDVSP